MEKQPYRHTLSAVFVGVFSVALALLTLLYFIAWAIKEQSSHKEVILARTSSQFDTVNTELLTVFTTFSHLQKSPRLQTLGESRNRQEMYYNAIGAQSQIAESMLVSGRLNYYTIAAVYMSEDADIVVTSTNSASLEDFAKEIGTEAEEIRSIYAELKGQPYGHNLLQTGNPDASGMINYLTLQQYNNGDLLFVLSIDRRNFKESFGELPCSDWIVCAEDTVLVGESDNKEHYESMVAQIRQKQLDLSTTLAPLDFKIEGQNMIGARFSEIGWTFFASYPSNFIGGPEIIVVFLLPLAVMVALSVFLARKLYRRLYAPVEKLLMRMGGDLESNVNEFEYIWDQTSQISQKANQLNVYLSRSQWRLAEQTIKNALLDANFADEENAAALADKTFVVALAELAEENPQDDVFEDARRVLRSQMQMTEDQHYISMGQTGFAMVFHCEETKQAAQRIQELFYRTGVSSRVQLCVALSSPARGLKNLHMLMEQCSHLMEYRYSLANRMFITAEDVAQIYYKGYYYPLKVEVNLVQMTVSGKEEALEALEDVMRENLINKFLSAENKRSFAFALVSTINRIYQELHLEENNDYPGVNELLACGDTDQLLQKIRLVFAKLVLNTASRNADLKLDAGRHMMEYIKNNYMKDISLDNMAEDLNISPKYCSALFKKQTGQTFKKVLNEYRIERAKELLRDNPDTKVGALALQVGFSNANTFIQVFKQYTGTTPHQYATQL